MSHNEQQIEYRKSIHITKKKTSFITSGKALVFGIALVVGMGFAGQVSPASAAITKNFVYSAVTTGNSTAQGGGKLVETGAKIMATCLVAGMLSGMSTLLFRSKKSYHI